MTAINILSKLAKSKDGSFTAKDAVSVGVSRTTLANFTKDSLLERIARGQYIFPDSLPDELYIWQKRSSKIIYSHETALYLHGMAERVPIVQSVTIPSTTKLSKTFPADYKVYYVRTKLYDIGTIMVSSKMGHEVLSYDMERTICDIVRSRSRIDDQLLTSALRAYAESKDKDFGKLGEYSEAFRVTNKLREYLEMLV